MKAIIVLGLIVAAWCAVAVVIFATCEAPKSAIGAACASVVITFASLRLSRRLREREEDRMFYTHPRV
ncbi:hypothetical protein OKA05_01925 [Luteolibacter arcticus]|uniref:Uncharacterized protein n=1 Tax=Luteolibacter arcticus TaxID=1581411 RepID=A0ABT3GDB6_9BACT|nr:hypothetical protein [Luteolibacter arcticus]MCW1921290.1 hypothetical protein [Luteolibacter arcticus]